MNKAVLYAAAMAIAASAALAADPPQKTSPAPFTLSPEQAALVLQLMTERRAAAAQIYNQANDIIASIERQAEQQKAAQPPPEK